MDIYARYASGDHDRAHFEDNTASGNLISLRPLCGQFDVLPDAASDYYSADFWRSVFPNAAFFSGHDPVLFGQVITMLYKSESTHKICALSITKYGSNTFSNLVLDASSRFWPACDNLLPKHRSSNVRKALAIVNLKNYNRLWNNRGSYDFQQPWDETNAGSLASSMEIVKSMSPVDLGEKILAYGFLQESQISSLVVDVVYDNTTSAPETVEENNSLVSLLGTQMLQLFDPLLEYSPQAMDFQYNPPQVAEPLLLKENFIVNKVLEELVSVQTNFTMDLVNILQDFIIPLRAHILSKVSKSTLGMTKVNLVFPPTIDEITRVNCIFNNSLKVAHGYGYVEVFKVLSTFIPFFYKAFARHQANVAKFHSNFAKFLKHNEKFAFDDPRINKGSYSPKRVENIITGSIYELSKLKLIIQRLFNVISSETLQMANFETEESTEIVEITKDYNVILEAINSLGYGDGVEKESGKSRVFTPTGKLLTELATEWPSELQYGWLTRKVLAIYELKSIEESSDENLDVLIVFSDHLLFIEVSPSKGEKSKLHLPDVLMDSLINQKPLPKLSSFPKLKVKHWCDIKQVMLRTYSCGKGQCINFFTYGENSFKSRSTDAKVKSLSYVIPSQQDSAYTCQSIMDHVCRAQILCKASPFHLFKNQDGGLNRFYCAQEESDYGQEVSKSLIAILLNMDGEKATKLLKANPEISLVINLSYLNQHSVHLSGVSRDTQFEIDEHVSVDEMTNSLRDMYAGFMERLLHSSAFTESLVETNAVTIEKILAIAEKAEQSEHSQPLSDTKKVHNRTSTDFDNFWKYPEVPESSQTTKEAISTEPQEAYSTQNSSPASKNFVSSFLRKLRTKSSPKRKSNSASHSAQVSIDNTGIPRGKKIAYKKLYKPAPSLDERSTFHSQMSNEKDPGREVEDVVNNESKLESWPQKTEQKRILSTNTASSSRYSSGSVDANSQYRFPLDNGLGDIDEHPSDEYNWQVPESKSIEKSVSPVGAQSAVNSTPADERTSFKFSADALQSTNSTARTSITGNSFDFRVKKFSHLPETPKSIPEKKEEGNSSEVDLPNRNLDNNGKKAQIIKPMLLDIPKAIAPSSPKEKKVVTEKEAPKKEDDSLVTSEKKTTSTKKGIFDDTRLSALEKMNATGVSPDVYAKYRIYDDIPTSVISGAGGANWTALARDSSSNLNEEIRAMQEELNSKRNKSPQAVVMVPPLQQFDSSNDTLSTFEMVTVEHNNSAITRPETQTRNFSAETIKANELSKEESQRSIDVVDQFGQEIDNYFSLSPTTLADPEQELLQFDTSKMVSVDSVAPPKPNMEIGIHTASSEDEFFSSHEFNDTVELMGREKSLQNSETSSTSERTLMNDFVLAECFVELEEKTHPSAKEQLPKVTKQTHVDLVEGDYLGRFESMAYLSDILNGNIVIE